MTIKRINGNTVLTLEDYPVGSLVHRELMGEHYVKLPFSLDRPVYFRIGDYIETDFGLFELTKAYRPKWSVTTGGYDYTLEIDAYYMKWKNKKVRYMPDYGAKEVTFKLTANADTHLNVVLRSINALGAKDSRFKYYGRSFTVQFLNFPESKRTVAKYYLYDKTDIISALDGLAQLYECEWWVEDNIIFFGKCEIGSDTVDFIIDESVDEMTQSDSDTEYANRVYAFGSTRNLPHNYEDVGGDVTVDGVVEKRLTLPSSLCPNGYLQDVNVRNESEAVEAVIVNEDIYPKVECVVGEVTTYDSEVENDDGTTSVQTFYRIKDSSGFQFSEDMILEGKSLHILFQSGSMNGMDFECHYDNKGKYYEVIVNEDYGRMLPDETLHPVVGMKFVLYNWDATKIASTGIIDDAKRKLFDYTFEYLKESKIDPSTYDCTMKSVWVYNDGLHFRTFDLGSRINLVNDAYFEQSRTSRIIGFEIKLDIPYDTPKYTVGEKAAYSRRKDMERQIEAVTVNGAAYNVVSGSGMGPGGGGGGTSIYVIKRYDGAIPSDYNVFSAKRAMDEFVSRKNDDTVLGKLTLKKGFDSELLSKLLGGAYFGTFIEGLKGGKIDENGDAELNNLIVRLKAVINELKVNGRSEFGDSLMSDDFTSGFIGGKGWAVMKERVQNALGVMENKYTGEFDNLIVRGALRIFTLVVSQLLGENDNRIFTAMLEVHHYDPNTGKVWFDTRNGKLYNPFRVGDYIMVQQYNGMPDSSNDYYVTKHYECVVTGAGLGNMSDGENRLDWVTIKNFMSADGKLPNDCIKKGDTFCRVDNETDADRKGIIQIITVGAMTPYMDIHYGLKTSPDDAHKGRIGNLKGINHYLFGQLEDFGAYLINLYAVGDFRVKRTGESVDAQLEMLKNQFSTQFQQQTYEMTEDDNYLTNATFTEDMDGWTTETTDQTKMLTVSGVPLVLNGATSIYGMNFARIENYEGKRMLRLRKMQIRQANSLIRKPGTHKEYTNADTETTDASKDVRDKLYMSIRYYVVSEGNMSLGFLQSSSDISDEPAEERAKFMPFMNSVTKQVTNKWVTEQFEGTWNGKGTFILSFTGEVYVSMLAVTDKPLDEFKRTVGTQIIQTASNIRLLGHNISMNGAAITQLGLDIDAAEQRVTLYVNKEIGDVTSLIDSTNRALSDLEDATDALRNLTDDVFKDGIVDNAERIAIEKYLNDLATAKKQMDGAYEEIINNEYLNKTENAAVKSNLQTSYTSVGTYYNTLVNTITAVIADGLAEPSEITQVNKAFASYNNAVKDFHKKQEAAQKAIEQWIKNYVDKESIRLGVLINGVSEQVTIYANKLTNDYYTSSQIDVMIGEIGLSVTKLDADYQRKINDLQGEVNVNKTAIRNLQDATDDLEDYVDGAFYDGIIENAEKVGIEKYLNDLATAKNLMDGAYDKLYSNEYLNKGTSALNVAKSNLGTAKTNVDTYYNTLVNTITNAIADGKVTSTENTQVNTAFTNYNSSVKTFNQRVEEAQKAIEDWMKAYVDSENDKLKTIAQGMADKAAMGEYYEQAKNPWNSWTSGQEMLHIGAKWKVTNGTGSKTYYTYDENGNLTQKTAEVGKIYRYVGNSGNRNVWEEIDNVAQSIAYLQLKKDYIAAVAVNFNSDGSVRGSSSIVTNAWANILAVNNGDLESKITQVAEGITINANRIHLEGYTTINYGFSIDTRGNMSCVNADVNGKITATSGTIGGFTISSYGLTNTSKNSYFDNDSYIILRNDTRKCFVGIGPNVTPAYSSLKALGRFEIEDTSSWWGGYNAALVLHAKNGPTNSFAFVGSGNGVLDGWIGGYRYSRFVCKESNTIYDGYVTLKDNNIWLVHSNVSSSGVALPKLSAVRTAIAIGDSTKFCIRLIVNADLGTGDFQIYGRNQKTSSSGNKPWNTDELPLITNWNGSNLDTIDMGNGDTVEFMLVYDPSRTEKIGDYTTHYTARIINRQN